MLNILKSKLIRIENLSNINDEKNLTLMLTDIIKTDETDKNNEENSFIKTLETDKDKADKDDQRQEYLLLSILFSSTLSFLSILSSLKNKHQEKRSVRNVENRSFLNIVDIFFENFSRVRKSTRKTIYCSTLNEISTESKEIFYAIFSAFLITVILKDTKLYCDNLSSKFKYYKEMIKHLFISESFQITFTEIRALQSKEI